MFGPDSTTDSVYEDGVKTVALSALMGINGNFLSLLEYICHGLGRISYITFSWQIVAATIFAYGQTSSGKTYTMRGITEKAVNDIYMHIINVSLYNVLL